MTTKTTFDVELRPIDAIQPYEANPRINDQAVAAVAASMEEFGFRQPIVIDADGVIICGHTRYKAAQQLGLAKVPVHVATDLPPEKVKAYRIADNQTSTLSEWDMDLLPIELKDLQQAEYDLSLLGFDEDELAHLLDGDVTEGMIAPDSIPAPPAMLTVDDVAAMLHCSTRTVYRLANAGAMPQPIRLNRLVRWPRSIIDPWIEAGCPRSGRRVRS